MRPPEPTTDFTAMGVTSPRLIDTAPVSGLVLCRLVVIKTGTRGRLTLNDCREVSDADRSNEIFSLPKSELMSAIFELFDEIQHGIVVSEIPRGGRISLSYGVARSRDQFSMAASERKH